MRRRLVCLANFYKHGGRCVAGVCLENGQWMRLRGKADDGALMPREYLLDDGSEARLLDVMEVELHYALPSDFHPEDWVVAVTPWRLVERAASGKRWKAVENAADKATTIFRGYRDRMQTKELMQKPLAQSLTLVCPAELWWWVREECGKRKYRAVFKRHDVTYDFAVTDPRWVEMLQLLPAGIYPHAKFVKEDSKTWLTVSLSEAFYGWHYKLVAGVVVQ